eukprot:56164-Chlamydomonas_euryale.AAC.10
MTPVSGKAGGRKRVKACHHTHPAPRAAHRHAPPGLAHRRATPPQVFDEYAGRRKGVVKALTTE